MYSNENIKGYKDCNRFRHLTNSNVGNLVKLSLEESIAMAYLLLTKYLLKQN